MEGTPLCAWQQLDDVHPAEDICGDALERNTHGRPSGAAGTIKHTRAPSDS